MSQVNKKPLNPVKNWGGKPSDNGQRINNFDKNLRANQKRGIVRQKQYCSNTQKKLP